MTCAELAKIITRRIITRSLEEPNPVEYFSKAVARALRIEAGPVEEMERELLEFGREFGLLVQGIEKEN